MVYLTKKDRKIIYNNEKLIYEANLSFGTFFIKRALCIEDAFS